MIKLQFQMKKLHEINYNWVNQFAYTATSLVLELLLLHAQCLAVLLVPSPGGGPLEAGGYRALPPPPCVSLPPPVVQVHSDL